MAHKTLVNGTAYDMGGGVTLVSGTSYHIKNGKVLIGGTAYDISFVLPPAVLDLWTDSGSEINCIAYANGYWVVGGVTYSSKTYYASIAYATSLDGTWTTKNLWSSSKSSTGINCIAYGNGYWVAGGSYYSSTYYARIAYATSPDGTWTTKNLWNNGSRDGYINCVTYTNNYWVAGGTYYNSSIYYARISYATTLSGTWSTNDLWSYDSGSDCYITCIAYGDGYWVAGGRFLYESISSTARIAYATSLSGTWTTKDLWKDSSDYTLSTISCITYANNYWVAGGTYYKSGSGSYARIAYATTPSGTWTIKDIWSGSNVTTSFINCIAYANGYWVVGGRYGSTSYARIAYVTSPDGTWTIKDIWSGSTNKVNCITYDGKYWVAGGKGSYGRLAYAGSLDELGNTE